MIHAFRICGVYSRAKHEEDRKRRMGKLKNSVRMLGAKARAEKLEKQKKKNRIKVRLYRTMATSGRN